MRMIHVAFRISGSIAPKVNGKRRIDEGMRIVGVDSIGIGGRSAIRIDW
jgi:hypothetical protein